MKYKVGQILTVKLSAGRIVDAEIKAIIKTSEGLICCRITAGLIPANFHLRSASAGTNAKIMSARINFNVPLPGSFMDHVRNHELKSEDAETQR